MREVPSLADVREHLQHVRRLLVAFVNEEFGFGEQAMLQGTLQVLEETWRLLGGELGQEFSTEEVEGVVPLVEVDEQEPQKRCLEVWVV